MLKDRCSQFKLLTQKIADTDFTGYTFQYPPLLSWKDKISDAGILKGWAQTLKSDPRHFGIYIHIPYCKQKCTYCRYFSIEIKNVKAELGAYLAALKIEISLYLRVLSAASVHSLYFGGGTPSLISLEQIDDIFGFLYNSLNFGKCKQVVFEGNPDFLDFEKIKLLKRHGVNRLTIGVQSLDAKVISSVNRYQKRNSFFRCMEAARKAGIANINVDLMAGLPNQTKNSFIKTLNTVISFSPEMIHIHPFCPTFLTPFFREGNRLSAGFINNRQACLGDSGSILRQHGYRPIKFDAWGKNEAARNIQLSDAIEYNSPFLGLGLGALSHATGRLRHVNKINFKKYVFDLKKEKFPIHSVCRMHRKEEMIYFAVASLRYGVIDKIKFRKMFKEELNRVFHKELSHLSRAGKVKETPQFVYSLMSDMEEYSVYSKYFYDSRLVKQAQHARVGYKSEINKQYSEHIYF